MSYSGKDYIGLGWFCQCVIHLIDSGERESLAVILDRMSKGNLVTYILDKHKTRFTPEVFNIQALNEFFSKWSYYAESRKSGVFGTDNGLLVILSVVLGETEAQIVNWKSTQ